jgi:hypothetical protein
MKLILRIDLGNEAMQTLHDVIRAMVACGNNFVGADDPLEDGDRARVMDLNGNTVGSWAVSE